MLQSGTMGNQRSPPPWLLLSFLPLPTPLPNTCFLSLLTHSVSANWGPYTSTWNSLKHGFLSSFLLAVWTTVVRHAEAFSLQFSLTTDHTWLFATKFQSLKSFLPGGRRLTRCNEVTFSLLWDAFEKFMERKGMLWIAFPTNNDQTGRRARDPSTGLHWVEFQRSSQSSLTCHSARIFHTTKRRVLPKLRSTAGFSWSGFRSVTRPLVHFFFPPLAPKISAPLAFKSPGLLQRAALCLAGRLLPNP